ncbi:GntR family transcriptional regulator [Blastococcus sp. SYSU D00820]
MPALAPGAGEFPRRTSADDVADALREAIVRGDFEDGEELNQVALAKHFGISRVPVREALRQLQAEGLVSARAHMRAVVTALTRERVAEVLDLRMLMEQYLLRRAAGRLTPADLAALLDLCDEMEKAEDHEAWLALNSRFHGRLYAAARADLALDLAQKLTARIQRYLHAGRGEGVHRNFEANAEHRQIVEAVAAGRVDDACRLLEEHIGATRERVLDLLEDSRVPSGTEAP